MCGRYSVLTEAEIIEIREILRELSLRVVKDEFDQYVKCADEIRPTDLAPVIAADRGGVVFENAKFGFQKWDGTGVIINARSETIKVKSTFSNLIEAGRCVVPASEYYEWQTTGNIKKKHYIKDKSGNLLFMAGLFRETEAGREFVIITKQPSGDVADIHNRMPVVLRVDQIEPWLCGQLSPEDLEKIDTELSVAPCAGGVGEQMSLFGTENG
jgi:putative SOS response-associated peptidase YedK